MKILKSLKNQRGESTLELMIALFILVVCITGIVVVIFGNQFLSLDSQMSNTALNEAQAALEQQRGNAKDNFNGIVAGTSTEASYTKTISVNNINPCQKLVTSIVAWPTQGGPPKQVSLTTLITNIAEQVALGGDCSGLGTKNPALICPNTIQTIGQPIDTYQAINSAAATDIKVISGVVYLTSVSPLPADPDFWVLNVDPTDSYSISVDRTKSIDTGTGGLNALEIAGNYAYAASASTTAQLQIISLATAIPKVVSSFGLPGNSAAGTAIAYRNGYVYIGTDTGSGNEFNIVNVSNPASPYLVKSYFVGGKINKINMVGSLAYLATSNPNKQLLELDVTNPTAISAPYVLNPSGSNGMQSLYFLGSELYSGSTVGSNPNFFITNLATFKTIGSSTLPSFGSTITGRPNDIVATGNLVFFGTSLGSNNKGNFLVLNASNSASPVLCPGASKSFAGASVTAMDFKGGLVYLVLNNNLPLKIIQLNY